MYFDWEVLEADRALDEAVGQTAEQVSHFAPLDVAVGTLGKLGEGWFYFEAADHVFEHISSPSIPP